MALSAQSQLDGLADRSAEAAAGAQRAMALAERLDCHDVYLHALTNLATAHASHDVEGSIPDFLAAIAEARLRGQFDLLPRMYGNLTYMMTYDRRFQDLFTYLEEGIAAAVARDNAPLEAYIRGARALALLDLGRTAEAAAEAEGVV